MCIKISTIISIGAWEQVKFSKKAKGHSLKLGFKIKIFITGIMMKLRACFCGRGDIQEKGVDVLETFIPMVSWSTVQLLLILTIVLGMCTIQKDYTAAFCQAPIDNDVYIGLP